MAIIRKPMESKQFTQVPNHWARDRALSIQAKGVLTYITTHADDYAMTVEQIVAENANGKHAVNSAIRELEARGYLVRTKNRRGGRFAEYDYELVEFPPEPTVADFQRRFIRDGKFRNGENSGGGSATKKTNPKNTKDPEDKDQNTTPSLSSGRPAATVLPDPPVPQQRERETPDRDQKFKSHTHRLFAKLNWLVEREVDYIVSQIEWRHDVRGIGFYIEADRNGTLGDLIQEVIDDWLTENPKYAPADFVGGVKPARWTERPVPEQSQTS